MKRNYPRLSIHMLLATTILLGAGWLGQSAAQTQAAPPGPHDLYLPLLSGLTLPSMVDLQDAYIANDSGNLRAAFLPGSAMRYTIAGSNEYMYPVPVTRRWTQDGPLSGPGACGDGLLFSNPLNLPPGAWQDTVQSTAASCYGIYNSSVEMTNGVETQALGVQCVIIDCDEGINTLG